MTITRHNPIAAAIPHSLDDMWKILAYTWTEHFSNIATLEREEVDGLTLRLTAKRQWTTSWAWSRKTEFELSSRPLDLRLGDFMTGPNVAYEALSKLHKDIRAKIRFAETCPTVFHAFAAQGWHDGK